MGLAVLQSQAPLLTLNFSIMKLMTLQLEQRFAEISSQEEVADPIVIAKYFLPGHSATWYTTEYDPILKEFFGYVTGLQEDEWGYVSLAEMEEVRSPRFNLPMERDLYCGEKRISEHCPELADLIQRRQEMIDIEMLRIKERSEDLER